VVATLDPVHRDSVHAVCMAGSTLFSGGRDHAVMAWDVDSMAMKRMTSNHKDWVLSLAAGIDQSNVFSGARDGSVAMWEASSGLFRGTFIAHRGSSVNALVATPSGLFTGSNDRSIKLWRASS